MKIIDLTTYLSSGMRVYPGDPPVMFNRLFSYKKTGYVITKITLGNHTGTHIDFPSHMIEGGKNQDAYKINSFFGFAVLYKKKLPQNLNLHNKYKIIILNRVKIDESILHILLKSKIKILGYSAGCDLKISFIKKLLKKDILLVGRLINLEKLPKEFYFSAFPLRIKNCDGSPVRAVAYL